ncbi:class I SAM-dependent methyltransferase [Candidatus Woesearchaeota archaeon]|nr:class I SAM-dependent methyltransferase [Candidatus Woesearchaeota archaeon]
MHCGSGEQAVYFAFQEAEVTVIDISPESIRNTQHLAKNKNVQLNAQLMSAESLSFSDQTFDKIYINSVLMHVHQEKVFQECHRVLKKTGTLVIVEPLRYTPSVQIYRLFSSYKETRPKYITLAEFKKNKSRFSEFSHQEFYFISPILLPLLYFKSNFLHELFFFASKKDQLLTSIFSFLKSLCWVSVVKYVK